jgi:hypothetical protein
VSRGIRSFVRAIYLEKAEQEIERLRQRVATLERVRESAQLLVTNHMEWAAWEGPWGAAPKSQTPFVQGLYEALQAADSTERSEGEE